ncbi:GGDEF domain-containing protein [Mesorhizobium sp. SP-1A]|uniref:GGDEF domain-containing protein n=1 Tax=Mesorhizobium sp. SP-1A TaxID=3077840 RepID=UPI0028F74D30|nr:GGDEF domain-containing protein [Mesorhizobium sp. SP-1A]
MCYETESGMEGKGAGKMGFDPDTLFFAAGICATALALTMLSMWLQNRMDSFLIGWMLGMVLLGGGVILYATMSPGLPVPVTIAFTVEIVGFVAIYVAARLFAGKQQRWIATTVLSITLALPVGVPIALGFNGLGIAFYNVLAALLLAMTALQYWGVRSEAPACITGVTLLYMLSALSFLACGFMLFRSGSWVLEQRPDNWAEHFNAIMSIAGITGIGALSLGLNQSRVARRHRLEAQTDALTGLLNRRALFDNLASDSLCPGDAVVVFDLDGFKSINDQFGHHAGDRVLCGFAQALRQNSAQGDLIARMGGEEFVLVMRKAPPAVAASTAERIRAAFAAQPVETAKGAVRGTASAGIGFCASPDEGFESVLHRADTALYRAKNTGRDRVATELQAVA